MNLKQIKRKLTGNEYVDFFLNTIVGEHLDGTEIKNINEENIYKDQNKDMEIFLDLVAFKLLYGKVPVFRISKEIFPLLLNTKNDMLKKQMPFEDMFIEIEQEFEIGDSLKKVGMSDKELQEHGLKDNSPNAIKCILKGLYIYNLKSVITITGAVEVIFRTIDGEDYPMSALWDTNIGGELILSKNPNQLLPKETKLKLKEFVCNILDFINHQDVEVVCIEEHKRNDRRMKKGKKPLPNIYSLVIKGNLKRYIYETLNNNLEAWKIGFRFWVRGHWRNFKNSRYKNVSKTWILPYIKGKGELINKKYYLGEKEQQWENERLMIEIIQSIYPQKQLQKHNRTILNGLEIDCYLPSLKLGFEYNGEQHYNHIKVFHKTKEDFEGQKQRDIKKNKRAKEQGIKLITIRYDEVLSKASILNKIKEVIGDGEKRSD